MDAIECGIVKLPRVPVADNVPGGDTPKFRNLWEHIGKKMPKKGRGKAKTLDPLSLPAELQTALEALYGHYAKTFELWEERRHRRSAGIHRRLQQHLDLEAGLRLHLRLPPQARRRHDDTGERPARALPQLRRPRQPAGPAEHAADRLRTARIRRGAGQGLPRDGRGRDRAVPPRDRRAHRRCPRRREHHRSGPAARGHEHRRQEGSPRRVDPLRRLRLDADRRLGRQHRHPHSRRPRLRHPASLRAGRRPRAAPPVLRPQRGRPVQRRICRRPRHPVRLRRQAGGRAAAASRARPSASMP